MSIIPEAESHKSIADQIIDVMFENLDSEEVFDAGTLKGLRELAATNGLSKPRKIEAAIKSSLERTQ